MSVFDRRHLFGDTGGDWTASVDAQNHVVLEPHVTLWVFLAADATTRTTDLQTTGEEALSELLTDSSGYIPRFRGPQGYTQLFVRPSTGGDFRRIFATDLAEDIEEVENELAGIEVIAGVQTINDIPPVGGNVTLAPSSLSPAAPTAATVTAIQALIGARVLQDGTGYPPRPTGAVFVIWVGTADPGAAALDGDIWLQPEV